MSFISTTLGRLMPRYRTVAEWSVIYLQIIDAKQVCDKTKANRRSALVHLVAALGSRTISAVRPHEISAVVNTLAKTTPQTAKRVLFECRDLFNEAVSYGWIDRNAASAVKPPQIRIQRKRLTLEQWLAIRAHAVEHMPPWVPRLLSLALVTGQRRSDLVKMRFTDVWDDHLHIEQAKTGARLALPLGLRMQSLGTTLGEVIEDCRSYAGKSEFMLCKSTGTPLVDASLSAQFEKAREAALPIFKDSGLPPSLHECRSLSERLYRAQGIDTMILLGHKSQQMTDIYNNDRGLTARDWKTLVLQ